jgi:hypothetical protein
MNTLIIRSQSDLSRAKCLNKWFHRPVVARVCIRSAGLDLSTRISLERRIEKLFNECGCGISAGVFVASALVSFFALRNTTLHWSGQVGTAVLQAFVFAIAAKAIVLGIAHVRLNNALRQLGQII